MNKCIKKEMLSWVIYITAILLLKKNLERMKNWRRRYKNYSFLRNKHKETLCRCVISIPFFFHHNLYVQKQRVEVTYTCILSFTVNLCECVVPVVSLNFSSSVCLDFVAGFWCQGSISGSHNQSHSYYFDYLCVTLSLPNFLYVEHCLTLCNYLSILSIDILLKIFYFLLVCSSLVLFILLTQLFRPKVALRLSRPPERKKSKKKKNIQI